MAERTFDASGADGRSGSHGQKGFAGGTGQRGGDGHAAGPPSPGAPGGEISLRLQTQGQSARVEARITGSAQPREEADAPALEAFPDLRPLARGGDGGDGGHGGMGGAGGRGSAGRDATRHSAGTSGGRGGDGGHGGPGTSGAPGGHGGTITVHLHERDAYLLMAIEGADAPAPLVSPGSGGRRGSHGVGGQGGSGGRGGRAHSWTTTDRDGNTRTHRQPGGSRGPSGLQGSTPLTSLHDGPDGRPGTFSIRLESDHGATSFSARYDLTLLDFEFIEAPGDHQDGVFEFGEEVLVKDLRVRNVGAMPTPAFQRVRLELQEGQWVRPVTDEALFLEQSLAPGEEHLFPGPLRFHIARPEDPIVGAPREATEEIRPRALQLGPEAPDAPGHSPFFRPYEGVALTRTLTARYPVENRDGVVALRSLAHRELTRMRFTLHNISSLPLGEASSRRRPLGLQIHWHEGDVPPEHLRFFDADARPMTLTESTAFAGHTFPGYFLPIDHLAAGDSLTLETRAGFHDAVEPYSSATLRFTLWIADVGDPGTMIPTQCQDLTLRLEPAFAYRFDSRVLLVSHNNTTRPAFLAWYHVLEDSMGLPTDFWSVSRYGHFDHSLELADETNLRIHLEDRLVVVLNQHFQPRACAETDLPTDYMRARDFRESASARGSRYLIIGEDDFQMEQWLEPNSDLRLGGADYPGVKPYLKAEARSAGTFVEETFRDDITLTFDEVQVDAWTFPLLRPGVSRLFKIAHRLQRRLSRLFPNRRYVVIYHQDLEPQKVGRALLLFPLWRIGHLEVRRSLNLDKSEAVALRASDDELNDEAFITGQEVRYALALALSFEEKLERLNWLLLHPERQWGEVAPSAEALVDAIITDLTAEQAALRKSRARLTDDFFEQRFAHFGRLRRYPFHTDFPAASPKWQPLIRLCAALMALNRTQDGGLLFRRRDRHIHRHLQPLVERFISDLFDGHAIDATGQVAMDSATALIQIDQGADLLYREIRGLFRAQSFRDRGRNPLRLVARRYFEHPAALARRVDRDIDRWLDPDARVWDVHELQRAQSDETARDHKQEDLRLLNEETRSDLLVRAARPARAATEPAPPTAAREQVVAVQLSRSS